MLCHKTADYRFENGEIAAGFAAERIIKVRRKVMNKLNIMNIWTEFCEKADHSMKDDFNETPYPDMEKIADYLSNAETVGISLKIFEDVFTGKTIGPAKYKEDDDYFWNSSLPYYIKKYNLRLPGEIERRILLKLSREKHDSQFM